MKWQWSESPSPQALSGDAWNRQRQQTAAASSQQQQQQAAASSSKRQPAASSSKRQPAAGSSNSSQQYVPEVAVVAVMAPLAGEQQGGDQLAEDQ